MAVVGSIMARLQADASPLSASLNQAASRVERFEKNSERQLGKFDKRWQQSAANAKTSAGSIVGAFGSLKNLVGPGFIGALTGGLFAGGVAAFTSQVGAMASEIADVGAAAKRAGLDAKSFQELAYVARQNKIDVDSLADGLKELSLRADEFIVTGAGSAADSFKRLGYSATELRDKLADPSALFSEVIGKLQKLDKAAQIRVADELFGGTGGEKFVQLIEQGEQGIRDTIDRAHELGLVMSDELIDKATELDRKFANVADTVGTALKSAVVEAASALTGFLDLFASTSQKTTGDLEAFLKAERETRAQWGTSGTDAYNASIDRESEILAELKKRAMAQLRIGLAALPSNQSAANTPPKKTATKTAAETEAERQQKAVESLIASLADERSMLGLSEVEQAKLTALRQAGAAATTDQRAQIVALIETTYAEREAIEQVAAAWQTAEDQAQSFASDFVSGLRSGEDAVASLGNAVGRLGDRLIDLALNQAISGLFSSLSGGIAGGLFSGINFSTLGNASLFADGGFTGYGAKHKPAGIVHAGEYVFDAAAVRRIGVGNLEMLRNGYAGGGYVTPEVPRVLTAANGNPATSGGAGTVQVFYSPTNNFPAGSSQADMAKFSERDRRAFERELPGMLSEGRRRGRL